MNPTASLRVRFALLGLLLAPLVSRSAEEFPLGPDSKVQPGVPQGELIKFEFSDSKLFYNALHHLGQKMLLGAINRRLQLKTK